MSDLIDRSKLPTIRVTIPTRGYAELAKHIAEIVAEAYQAMVDSAPAVDAVEVVRCKDCKYRGDAYKCPMYFAHMHCDDDDRTSDDGFCERGAQMYMEV